MIQSVFCLFTEIVELLFPKMRSRQNTNSSNLDRKISILLLTVSKQNGSRLPLYMISTLGFFFWRFEGCCDSLFWLWEETFSFRTGEGTAGPYLLTADSMSLMISSRFSFLTHCFLDMNNTDSFNRWRLQSSIWHSSLQYVHFRQRPQLEWKVVSYTTRKQLSWHRSGSDIWHWALAWTFWEEHEKHQKMGIPQIKGI